jgi:hypothetical protein
MGAEDIALRAGDMDRDTGTGMIGITSRGNTETMVITGRGATENTMIGRTNRGDTHASTTSAFSFSTSRVAFSYLQK